MAKAKKSAVKKGKYSLHISWATHQPRTKPSGPARQEAWLPLYGFGMLGWQLSLSGHEPEDKPPSDYSCERKSLVHWFRLHLKSAHLKNFRRWWPNRYCFTDTAPVKKAPKKVAKKSAPKKAAPKKVVKKTAPKKVAKKGGKKTKKAWIPSVWLIDIQYINHFQTINALKIHSHLFIYFISHSIRLIIKIYLKQSINRKILANF